MARNKKTDSKEQELAIPLSRIILRYITAFIFLIAGTVLLLGIFERGGFLGEFLSDQTIIFLGYFGVFWIAYLSYLISLMLFRNRSLVPSPLPFLGHLFLVPSLLSLFQSIGLSLPHYGKLGNFSGNFLAAYFGFLGAFLVAFFGIVIALIFFALHYPLVKKFFESIFGIAQSAHENSKEYLMQKKLDLSKKQTGDLMEDTEENEPLYEEIPSIKKGEILIPNSTQKDNSPDSLLDSLDFNSRQQKSLPLVRDGSVRYTFPPLSLLKKTSGKPNVGNIPALSESIEHTLKTFGIPVEMDEVTIGPSVTRFSMKPASGVKLSKILALQSNLELSLATQVRIEAPIPGKSLVGIEIPNPSKSTIGLGSLLGSIPFKTSDKPLYFALGMNIENQPLYADLAKLPHLLIAGTTGAGKSATVHNIILSLLYKNGPETLRLIMIDPKRVELTLYGNIPHLLTPVIKTAKQAVLSLKWAVKEMERRYDVLESHSVQNIASYHKNILEPKLSDNSIEEKPEHMPYIVVVIDEMSDLMQSFPKELEAAIVRLAQMSRAVGIHLILSTQRPSVNVITGLIKANVPGRIALRVSSQIDSRTIMDCAGAEKLLGAGDMLFTGNESSRPIRIQSAYASEEEVKEVVSFIVKHNDPDPGVVMLGGSSGGDDGGTPVSQEFNDDDDDDLYEDAKQAVIQVGKASTSYLQRKLRVGYSRAARLMDILESRGVIGPQDGAKPRSVIGAEKNSANNSYAQSKLHSDENEPRDSLTQETTDYENE